MKVYNVIYDWKSRPRSSVVMMQNGEGNIVIECKSTKEIESILFEYGKIRDISYEIKEIVLISSSSVLRKDNK